MTTFYSFSMPDHTSSIIPFDHYQGKVVLIFNSALKCGLKGQYSGIQKLFDTYHDKGLEVLDFPCNQFKEQSPGGANDIAQVCETKYGVTFSVFDKIDVNGPNAAPLYQFLKKAKPKDQGSNFLFSSAMTVVGWTGNVTRQAKEDIQWNFTKFLINRKGEVVDRFAPTVSPLKMKSRIEQLLSESP